VLSDDVKRQVQQATDIVALIGEHVALTSRGREFVGLCCFHDDRRPSMYVNPVKQIFKCFACGAGGDVFSFVMDYHKMSFPEALRHLAERAHIKLPDRASDHQGEGQSPRQRLLDANARANDFFRKQYQHPEAGRIARDYVASRNISQQMVTEFQIGYAPDQWDALARQIPAKGWDHGAFEQLGLVTKRSGGDGFYDRLRHRLIFPICDGMGRVIAFGGRVLTGSTRDDHSDAKYLNSPETPLFNKSATLFGLHLAQKPIIDSRTAVIVEGYTDVIACHQAGVRNVVATLGTALTKEHATVLRRYCDKVVLVFDGDEAGQKAADRALTVFFQETLDVAIAILPDELDPADLMNKPDGPAVWQDIMHQAVDAMTFQFQRIRRLIGQTDTLAGRQRIATEYLRSLAQLGLGHIDLQRRGLIFARISELLSMTPAAVQDAMKQLQQPASRTAAATGESAPRIDALGRAQRHIVGCLLNQSALFHIDLPDGRPFCEMIAAADFTDPLCARLFELVSRHLMAHEDLSHGDLRDIFADEALLREALDVQMEVDRLTDCDPGRLMELFLGSSAALLRHWADQQYLQKKLDLRDADGSSSGSLGDIEAQRLAAAIAHVGSNPSAKRMPRPIG
jgi:DNA primase